MPNSLYTDILNINELLSFCWLTSLIVIFLPSVKCFHILLCNSHNLTSVFCLHTVKCFQVMLCGSHNLTSDISLHTVTSIIKCFQTLFVWALLLIVHTLNSSPLQSNLLQLQCTCRTIPTTSGRPHGSPLVWACQWPSSQSLSSPQLSHNDSLWA